MMLRKKIVWKEFKNFFQSFKQLAFTITVIFFVLSLDKV